MQSLSEIKAYMTSKGIVDVDKVTYLGRGQSNDNYLIDGENKKCVLRVRRNDIPLDESKLSNERTIYGFLEHKAYPWTPRSLYFDSERPAHVVAYIPGKTIDVEKLIYAQLETLAEQIMMYHGYQFEDYKNFCTERSFTCHKPITPMEDFERFERRYAAYIEAHFTDEDWILWIRKGMRVYERKVRERPLGEPKLIHGDVWNNILSPGGTYFWFIDWEQGRFSYYDDIGYLLGNNILMKELSKDRIDLYLKYTGKDKETLAFELTYVPYFKYFGGALWSLCRYLKMKKEALPKAETYLTRAKKNREKFDALMRN